jgi:hypothetical protein
MCGYRHAAGIAIGSLELTRSQSALGSKFCRLRTRLGAAKAITAMA